MPRDVGVIIVAAGQGTRIGGVPKQYRTVGGVPIVLRALRPFTSHEEVVQVVLVLPPADVTRPPPFLAEVAAPGGIKPVPAPGGGTGDAGCRLTLAAGGAERMDSVAAGLAELDPSCALVLVHDAARPFVEARVIDAVIREARTGAGALAAIPVSDTIKEVAPEDHRVLRTVPREQLWRAQTPQGFPRTLLAEAHARARRDGVRATDDAALVERLGVVVHVVPDSPGNVKITTADDLARAEAWAARG